MTEYNLGHVVGSDGAKGDKGDKGDTGATGNGISSITLISTSGKVKTYRITYTNGEHFDFQVTDGNDGSADIVTDWETTPSDSKVASEKLTKDTLDTKIDTSSIADNLTTNDATKVLSAKQGYLLNTAKLNISQSSAKGKNVVVNSTSGFIDFEEKPSIPSSSSDLSDGSDLIKKSSTSGLLKNDGTIMTSGTGSTNYSAGDHTHSGYASSTHVHGNLTNDGKVGSTANYFVYTTTSGAITSKQKIGNITTSGAIGSTTGKPIITTTNGVLTTGSFGTSSGTFAEGNHTHSSYASSTHTHGNLSNDGKLGTTSGKPVITTTDGAITVGSFGTSSGTFAEGNHTHSGYVSATKVTSWQPTPSDSNVPSEKLVSDTFDAIEDLIGDAISYINQ